MYRKKLIFISFVLCYSGKLAKLILHKETLVKRQWKLLK